MAWWQFLSYSVLQPWVKQILLSFHYIQRDEQSEMVNDMPGMTMNMNLGALILESRALVPTNGAAFLLGEVLCVRRSWAALLSPWSHSACCVGAYLCCGFMFYSSWSITHSFVCCLIFSDTVSWPSGGCPPLAMVSSYATHTLFSPALHLTAMSNPFMLDLDQKIRSASFVFLRLRKQQMVSYYV